MQNKRVSRKACFRPIVVLTILMICVSLLFFSHSSFSQDSSDYANALDSSDYATARTRLVKILKKRFIDKAYEQSIDRFYFVTCDSLIKQGFVVEDRPIRDILFKLFITCEDKINDRSITSLRIPAVNNYFLIILQAYKTQPISKLYREIGITQTAILQSAFDGLLLGDSIRTFVGLQEMLNDPYQISTCIKLAIYSDYQDTLLYYLANQVPEALVYRLRYDDSFFRALVGRSHNMTVKAVSAMVMDESFSSKLPFSLAIFENRISADEIRNLSYCPAEYYHAFVEEALRLHNSSDPETNAFLREPIAELNKRLANGYFIDEINSLHDSPDRIRFRVIDHLPAKDLYFLLIGGTNQLYTSSFLFVYRKLLLETAKEGLNKFFDDIGYYRFDQFLSNISVYGLVNDLVSHLKGERSAHILTKYLASLQNPQLKDDEIILNSMTMSEVLDAVRHYPALKKLLIADLKSFGKPGAWGDFLLQRMYIGFLDILEGKPKYNTDKIYDVLSIDRLKSKGMIVQVWFFYDDGDASLSFSSGTAMFDTKTWKKTDLGNYVVFHSKVGNKMMVYMNKPCTDVGFDAAQSEMLLAIRQQGSEITSFIHRGHSYHVANSLTMITPSAQFVFLGSCGGTKDVLQVFRLNPDVNVIVTRHIGSRLINDHMLAKINRNMVNNRDIRWDVLWKEFNSMFQSKQAKDLFSSYIPPNKYLGVKFIRNVFNY